MSVSFDEKPKNTARKGIFDMWKSSLYQGVTLSELDNPLVHTTATDPPKAVVSWHEAKNKHAKNVAFLGDDYHINAFLHCYIDDVKFDGEREGI